VVRRRTFTADDVEFTWEGYVADTNVNALSKIADWTWEGKPAEFKKVDDYTIQFTFPIPSPWMCTT